MISNLFLKFGKIFLKKYFRLIFLFICLTPVFFTSIYIFSRFQELKKNQLIVENAFSFFQKNYKKRTQQKTFIEKYSKADPNFIRKNLESLQFMNEEKINLEKLYNNDSFKGATLIKNRLNFLKNENKLLFKEDVRFTSPNIKETLLKLTFPLEINEDDLKNILSFIEELNISKINPMDNSPQLIIQNFELKKTNSSFIINNLTIFKRDFIK